MAVGTGFIGSDPTRQTGIGLTLQGSRAADKGLFTNSNNESFRRKFDVANADIFSAAKAENVSKEATRNIENTEYLLKNADNLSVSQLANIISDGRGKISASLINEAGEKLSVKKEIQDGIINGHYKSSDIANGQLKQSASEKSRTTDKKDDKSVETGLKANPELKIEQKQMDRLIQTLTKAEKEGKVDKEFIELTKTDPNAALKEATVRAEEAKAKGEDPSMWENIAGTLKSAGAKVVDTVKEAGTEVVETAKAVGSAIAETGSKIVGGFLEIFG